MNRTTFIRWCAAGILAAALQLVPGRAVAEPSGAGERVRKTIEAQENEGGFRWRLEVRRAGGGASEPLLETTADFADPGRQITRIHMTALGGFDLFAAVFGEDALARTGNDGVWRKEPREKVGFHQNGILASMGEFLDAARFQALGGPAGNKEEIFRVDASAARLADLQFRDVEGAVTLKRGRFDRMVLEGWTATPGLADERVVLQIWIEPPDPAVMSFDYWDGVAEALRTYEEKGPAAASERLDRLHAGNGVSVNGRIPNFDSPKRLVARFADALRTKDRYLFEALALSSNEADIGAFSALYPSVGEETLTGSAEEEEDAAAFRLRYKDAEGVARAVRLRCVRGRDGDWRISEIFQEPGPDAGPAPADGAGAPPGKSQPDEAGPLPLGACLAAKGFKMYGSARCPACQSQRAAFQGDPDFMRAVYVECDGPEGGPCRSLGVKRYPTWIDPDGSRREGALSPDELSGMAGCDASAGDPPSGPDVSGPENALRNLEKGTAAAGPEIEEKIDRRMDGVEKAVLEYAAAHGVPPQGMPDLVRDRRLSLNDCLDPWGNYYLIQFQGSDLYIATLGSDRLPGGDGEAADVARRVELK